MRPSTSKNSKTQQTDWNQRRSGGLKDLRPKDLDILAPEFSLRFNTVTGKFQTTIGGYLTLMVGLICFGALIAASVQYFHRNAPVVTTSLEAGSTKNEFNMYHEGLWLVSGYAIGNSYLQEGERERFITTVWVVEDSFFNTTTNHFEKKLVRIIESAPCQKVSDDPIVKEHYQQVVSIPGFENIVVCLDLKSSGEGALEDFKISQDTENLRYRTVSMKVYPCSLENPDECAKRHQMIPMRADYSNLEKLINSSNFEKPVIKNYDRAPGPVDLGATKILKKVVRRARIVDDINRFGPPIIREEFSKVIYGKSNFKMRDPNQLHCSKAQIYSQGGGGCQEYVSFEYSISPEVEVIRRNYKSFTTLLGELGGLLKILTTMVFFFYSIYNYKKIKYALSEIVLTFDPSVIQAIEAKNKSCSKTQKRQESGSSKSLDKKKSEAKGIQQVSVEKAVNEIVKQRASAEGLLEKLNFLELLENVFFTDYEKKLIPLVLLRLRLGEKRKSKVKEVLANPETGESQSINRIRGSSSDRGESKTGDLLAAIREEMIEDQNKGIKEDSPKNQILKKTQFQNYSKEDKSADNTETSSKEGQGGHMILGKYQTAFKKLKLKKTKQEGKEGVMQALHSYIVESLEDFFNYER